MKSQCKNACAAMKKRKNHFFHFPFPPPVVLDRKIYSVLSTYARENNFSYYTHFWRIKAKPFESAYRLRGYICVCKNSHGTREEERTVPYITLCFISNYALTHWGNIYKFIYAYC